MWDKVIPGLSSKFYVIAFDIRGAGKSINYDDSLESFSFNQYSDDLNQILRKLGLKNTYLEHGLGTRAALAYCSLNVDRILSAVFSDASIASADIKAQRKGMKEAIAKQELIGIDSFDLPEQWNYHLDQKSADLSLTAAARFKLDKVVASIKFLLVMTGDHDPNLDSSEEIVSASEFGELKVLENVGHGSVLQRPDLTLKKFMEWHGC